MRFVSCLCLIAAVLGIVNPALAQTSAPAGADGQIPPMAAPPLLPMPAKVLPATGHFNLAGASLAPSGRDKGIASARERLAQLLGRNKTVLPSAAKGTIRFLRDHAISGNEAYRLVVGPDGITISASGDAGLYYGAETLWQLIASAPHGSLAAMTIDDRPALAWRGFMLDSVRHFQSIAFIKRQLDRMAIAKLNMFHWHLTDDQGWRVPIDRYPRLTSVGAWRTDALTGKRYGGYYTKAEIRAVVAYAAARHITVVPEIEMPGHATAMIAAYPWLASIPNPPGAPSQDWGVLPNLLNPDQRTFTFVEHVLDEVMALFPGLYIHTGGDEAPKDQWQANPQIEAQRKQLGLADDNALQGWFTAHIAAYLAAHHRRLVGWDEILEGKVPQDAVVMSWRGINGAITAAKAGHDTVLAPAPVLYLDNRQSDADAEPPGRGTVIDWRHLYAFDAAPAELTPDQLRHVIGLQANLWTEHAPTEPDAERLIWPRAAIAAELAWNPAGQRQGWSAFASRLLAALARWDRLGWAYDAVPLAPELKIDGTDVAVVQPAGIGTLHVTRDGSAPDASSPAYTGPIDAANPLVLRARSFLGGLPVGPERRWTVDAAALATRSGNQMATCQNKVVLRLAGPDAAAGPTAAGHTVDIMDACWRWTAAPTKVEMPVVADLVRVPYNFSLGKDMALVHFDPSATPGGELVIHQDRCDGPVIGTLPLPVAATRVGTARVTGRIAPTTPGSHDLCMKVTQAAPDPLWVLDRLTLEPAS